MPWNITKVLRFDLFKATYRKVRAGKHLSDAFSFQSGVKQGDALPLLLLNFTSEYVIHESQEWLDLTEHIRQHTTKQNQYIYCICVTRARYVPTFPGFEYSKFWGGKLWLLNKRRTLTLWSLPLLQGLFVKLRNK